MEVYHVKKDQWSLCQTLNEKRADHSSCILGGKLYISGGDDEGTIEVADCKDLIDGSATW